MSKFKNILISFLIIALLVISAYFIFNYFHNKSANLTDLTRSKIRIGYTPTASSLGVFVAQEKDYFKDQGLKVELIEFQSSNLMTDAIIRGDIDSGCCTGIIAPLEANIISPNKIKLFTVGDESKKAPWNQLIVKSNSTISNLKDLENKKIGVFPGSFATPVFKKYLGQNGIDTAKIEISPLAVAAQLPALESGSIDALFAYEPTATIALQNNTVKVIDASIFSKQNKNASTGAGYIATKFINEQPDQAKKFVQAMDKAHKFMYDNPSDAAVFQVKYTKIDPKIAAKAAFPDFYQNTELKIETIQSYTDFLADIGVMKQKVVVKDLIYQI